MSDLNLFFESVKQNNDSFDKYKPNRILILWRIDRFYIGDTCLTLNYYNYLKYNFNNSVVEVNISDEEIYKQITHIIKNIPETEGNFFSKSWDKIDFNNYDLILCDETLESDFIKFFTGKYLTEVINKNLKIAIYSIGLPRRSLDQYINRSSDLKFVNLELPEPDNDYKFNSYELVLTEQEVNYSSQWLIEKGLGVNEKLIILIDNSSDKQKVLNPLVYFELLEELIKKENTKILIFDENNIGKKSFYKEWLGNEKVKKMIFAEGLNLRKALTIIGNPSVKMMIGPCTGLLHCASGIYRNYINRGIMKPGEIPLMVTYVGMNLPDYNAWDWWYDSLVNCIVITRNKDGQKKLRHLSECPRKNSEFQEICSTVSEIDEGMIYNFINSNFRNELKEIDLL